jgi:hypothetical protein
MNTHLPANASNARLPASYEAAKQALAQCEALDECKDWADKAAALASYARQAEDVELERKAARIRARAMRRAGELLQQFDGRGGDQIKSEGAHTYAPTQREAAEQAGMSKHQQVQAVRIASVPTAEFEKAVESSTPPTITTLAQQGVQKRAAPDPQTWLKGRDPVVFNKAMHFTAMVEEYAKALGEADLKTILPNLDERQADRVRNGISVIDTIHDTVATRI